VLLLTAVACEDDDDLGVGDVDADDIGVVDDATTQTANGATNGATTAQTPPAPAPDAGSGDGDDAPAGTDDADDALQGSGLALVPELVRMVEPSVVAVQVATTFGQFGEGSGVIIRDDGIIVTNNHVVQDAGSVTIALADGTRVEGEVIATDPFTDLALVSIDREGLPAARLADEYPEIGELAVALGNPLGFENSVTAGIISGLGRAIPEAATRGGVALVDLVQTDAAISPGNSGGALVGADGRVVGINVAYIPPVAGAVSLGFAIPAPTVSDVVNELLQDGSAEHAYLGANLTTVTPQIAEQYGLTVDAGVGVLSVEAGGPADAVGIEPGDVITEIDGEPVRDLAGFLTALRRYDPSDGAELTIVSNGAEGVVPVIFTSRPD
jgi:serine protease DegQ